MSKTKSDKLEKSVKVVDSKNNKKVSSAKVVGKESKKVVLEDSKDSLKSSFNQSDSSNVDSSLESGSKQKVKREVNFTALLMLIGKVTFWVFLTLVIGLLVSAQYLNSMEIKDLRQTLDEMNGPWSKAYSVVRKMPVSRTKIQSCLDNNITQIDSKINLYSSEAISQGQVQGTPFSFVYDKQSGNRFYVSGALSEDQLKQFMDSVRIGKQINIGDSGDHSKLRDPDLSTEALLGNRDARFVWVLYSDFECPYCKSFYPVITKYVKDNSDLALVYRHLPLTSIHPNAQSIAQVSECVLREYGQEMFWEFADKVEAL